MSPLRESLANPGLRQLYDYWLACKGNRMAPARADIQPADIPRLLPHLMIWQIDDEADAYVCRLCGTEAARILGTDVTGRSLDEVFAESLPGMRDAFEGVRRNCDPHARRLDAGHAGRAYLRYERLLLPLSSDGLRVNMLLCGLFELPAG